MDRSTNSPEKISFIDQRIERREPGYYPRAFVNIKPLDDHIFSGALIVDSSESGLALLSSLALPPGTRIALNMDNEYAAIGEVVNIDEDCGDWDWNGMSRLGVKFIDKMNWPY